MQTIDVTTLATVTGGTTTNARLLRQLGSLNSSLRAVAQPQPSQQLETLMVGALAARALRNRG